MVMGRIVLRLGGYGPETTNFSQALRRIGNRMETLFPGRVEAKYTFNIMDLGHRAEEIITLVEDGQLSLGYQSSSYFTDRVTRVGFLDLPFLFPGVAQARAAMDGRLGTLMGEEVERATNLRILGWLENGFRHISNRLRPVRVPADLAGMRVRVLPSLIQARTFELLGAVPLRCDLSEALAMIRAGTIDAQENPLTNTVTYGVHPYHRFHTLTGHFYISRPIFVHRGSFDAWPDEVRMALREAVAEAVAWQRATTVAEHDAGARTIKAAGGFISTPTADQRRMFVEAVAPLRVEARRLYGEDFFSLANGTLLTGLSGKP
jgi:TRAP-type C4-dicarboxylate transport system substrate-binding protein